MRPFNHGRRYILAIAILIAVFLYPLFTGAGAVDPGSFNTAAKFSVDHTAMSLSIGIATIEPRLGAPGYSWLRINFYSFPVGAADVPNILNSNVESMNKKRSAKSSKPNDYNTSNAVIRFSVDSKFNVWQVDMAVPGYMCTIAPFEPDVKNFLQTYEFDGRKLRLKSKGSYVCDMNFKGTANHTFSWDIDANLPVFEKRK